MHDFKPQERHEEILALMRMMNYAANIASELDAHKASALMGEARSALFSVLQSEFPTFATECLHGFAGGRC